MSSWKRLTLGDVIDIKHGYAFKGEYFCDDPTHFLLLTPGNFAIGGGFQEKPKFYNGPIPECYVLAKDDLIVTMTDLSKQGDTLGYSALVPVSNRYLHNQRIGLVTIKNPVVFKGFIYWLMRTWDYQRFIVNHASGSTVKHTSPKTVLSYEFKAPSIEEQRTIVATLSAIDDKIANNAKINHHLEQMAQAIFRELCSEGKNAVLSDILTVCYGKDHKRLKDGEIPCYGSGGIMRYVDEAIYNGESVLIPRKGSLNNVLYINEPFWTVDTMFYTHMTRPNVAKFVYFTVRDLDLAGMNVGSVVPSMTTAVLNALEFVLPSDDVLASFEETVSPVFLEIQVNNTESARLASLRDTLLPRLMSGELSVADLGGGK